ncbi:HAD hydrolase-like protein [Aliarcobacter butzleri]|uniref:HAD hydrolase-like protein n=1 Tax=Aliarcobacter butzleri TaxID=28197 RepID=UPI001EDA73F2|nr:HAD hydrolase-like protein [Aliarcobacter butzleri]MCG3655866.1 HAD hydrolase-like protein [Aliarcobacter butzleri]
MIKMVIFDLDDTLVDSSCFEEYRIQKKWEKLDEEIHNFKILFDAKETIDFLKKEGLNVSLITTSPKNKYAKKVVEHFGIDIPLENIYGFEDLKSVSNLPIKTNTICEIKTKYGLSTDEMLFVGDSEKDFLACATTNIPFVSYRNSSASKFFDNKLLYIDSSYLELEKLIEDFKDSGFSIFKREHQYIGSFFTFSNYIKDIYNDGNTFNIEHKITYDCMHERIIELKNNSIKSAVNWLYFLSQQPLKEYFIDIDFVVRALGSSECIFDNNKITTLDLIGFYIASKTKAQYKPTLLIKNEANEKLHLSGKNRDGRKEIISGKYNSFLDEDNKSVLVIDDLLTTGATLEEIKRAIVEKNPTVKVNFSTIAETATYKKELYLENILNSRHFFCADDIFNRTKFSNFNSILAAYLYSSVSHVKKEVHAKGKYITYIMDVHDIKVLNRKLNNFVYCSLVLDDENFILRDLTKVEFFDNLNDCKLYNNPKVPQFVKDIMKNLYEKF